MKKGLLEKVILCGMGLASITQDKAKKIVDELVKEGEMSDKDASAMAKRIADNFEKSRKDMEKATTLAVKTAIAKIDVPSRKEIASLEKKIDELNKKLAGKQPAAKK